MAFEEGEWIWLVQGLAELVRFCSDRIVGKCLFAQFDGEHDKNSELQISGETS